MDWWTVGSEWREKRNKAEHGELERLIAEFVEPRGIGRSTVRRCEAAIAFSERLVSVGLVANARDLGRLPLKAVAALHRISRYGLEEVAPILGKLLGPDPPGQVALAVLEREVRARLGSTAGGSGNAHALRQGRQPLRKAALIALRRWYTAPGSMILEGPFALLLDPLTIDVMVRRDAERDHLAFRLLPATADARPRPRVREEFIRAVSAARVFNAVYLVAARSADAEMAVSLVHRTGKCGVGVLLLDPDVDRMRAVAKAERTIDPDLEPAYRLRLQQASRVE